MQIARDTASEVMGGAKNKKRSKKCSVVHSAVARAGFEPNVSVVLFFLTSVAYDTQYLD